MTFLTKTSKTKKFLKIFCEAFLILQNILLKPSRTYFHFYKTGFLNSQAVRIRVKEGSFNPIAVRRIRVKTYYSECRLIDNLITNSYTKANFTKIAKLLSLLFKSFI
jgi:hypothetical protein